MIGTSIQEIKAAQAAKEAKFRENLVRQFGRMIVAGDVLIVNDVPRRVVLVSVPFIHFAFQETMSCTQLERAQAKLRGEQ